MSEFDELLNLPAIVQDCVPKVSRPQSFGMIVGDRGEIDDAYVDTKTKLDELFEQGRQAIQSLAEMASASDDPKAYTALAKLIDVTAGISGKKMDALQQRNKLLNNDLEEPGQERPVVNQTAVFMGSTAELLDTLRNKNNGKS